MAFEAAKPLPLEEARIREFDRSGELVVAGFKWFEVRPSTYGLYNGLLRGGFVALAVAGIAAVALFFNKATGAAAAASSLILVIGAGLLLLTKVLHPRCFQRHAFKANRDGTVFASETRGAVHVNREPTYLEGTFSTSDIASIEPRPMTTNSGSAYIVRGGLSYPGWRVDCFLLDGRRLGVASCLSEDGARLVSTQLNIALQELREAGG